MNREPDWNEFCVLTQMICQSMKHPNELSNFSRSQILSNRLESVMIFLKRFGIESVSILIRACVLDNKMQLGSRKFLTLHQGCGTRDILDGFGYDPASVSAS